MRALTVHTMPQRDLRSKHAQLSPVGPRVDSVCTRRWIGTDSGQKKFNIWLCREEKAPYNFNPETLLECYLEQTGFVKEKGTNAGK